MNAPSPFPRVGELKTEGHRLKVRGEWFKRNLRGNFFTQRVVRVWNEVPEKVVEAGTIATFKKHLNGKGLRDMDQTRAFLD